MDRYYFIWKAIQKYGYGLDYREVPNINNLKKDRVPIICDEHGRFYQIAQQHLYYARGCKGCQYSLLHNLYSKGKEQFIEDAIKICGDKYDFSDIEYYNSHSYIYPTCKKHGVFKTKPLWILQGKGCPKCKQSHLENELELFFKKNNIRYESQKAFDWLRYNGNKQFIDFYLTDFNIAIECQGIQHFKEDNKRFKDISAIIDRDKNKNKLCFENGVKLIYFTHAKEKYILPKHCEIYNNENLFYSIEDLNKIL